MTTSKVYDGYQNIHGGIEAQKIDTGTSSCIQDVSQEAFNRPKHLQTTSWTFSQTWIT